MEDNRKLLGLFIIVVGVLLLIGIVYVIFFHNFGGEPTTENTVTQQAEQPAASETPAITTPAPVVPQVVQRPAIKKEFGEDDLKQLAMSFAERFGSFSNQSDFGHLTDLKVFMSDKMSAWADQYISDEIAKKNSSSIYYGISTRAVVGTVDKYDDYDGVAQVTVGARRQEATGDTTNTSSFTQNIVITFVKEHGAWKVDSATWGSK